MIRSLIPKKTEFLPFQMPFNRWNVDISRFKNVSSLKKGNVEYDGESHLENAPLNWSFHTSSGLNLPYVPPVDILRQYGVNVFDPSNFSIFDLNNTKELISLNPQEIEERPSTKRQREVAMKIIRTNKVSRKERIRKALIAQEFSSLYKGEIPDNFDLEKLYDKQQEERRVIDLRAGKMMKGLSPLSDDVNEGDILPELYDKRAKYLRSLNEGSRA